jgi:hypothetical protein
MHFVTSSVSVFSRRPPLPFVSSFSPPHYFSVSCAYWVSRSRLLDILLQNRHRSTSTRSTLHFILCSPPLASRPRPTGPERTDASHSIVLTHPGERLCQMQRVLDPFLSLRGTVSHQRLRCDFGKADLPRGDVLDLDGCISDGRCAGREAENLLGGRFLR